MDDQTRQLKQEQNLVSQLRFQITANEDTINRMSQDTDQLVQQFIQKKDQHKQQLRDQKQKMIDQVTEIDRQHTALISKLTQEKEEAERALMEAQNQLQQAQTVANNAAEVAQDTAKNELGSLMKAEVAKLKQKHEAKEKRFKDAIQQLGTELNEQKASEEAFKAETEQKVEQLR